MQDQILGSRPAAELAREMNTWRHDEAVDSPQHDKSLTDHMGGFQFPRRAGHGIHSICATHADGKQAKPSSIWGVRVYRLASLFLLKLDGLRTYPCLA